MLTQEASGPYDRTILSKQMTKTAEELLLRKPPFYQEHGIELVTETKVVGMDTKVMNGQRNMWCFEIVITVYKRVVDVMFFFFPVQPSSN